MRHKGKAGTMTGGMAIVEALIANGVDTVFGLPGAQLYALFDALQQKSDQIRTVGARHEQACGYMAFGYARSTGRPGGFAVVPKAPAPSPLEVEAAAKLVAAASRPMIMTGTGAQHASEAVRALAEELDAPVAAFRGGRGIVPEDHELGISSYAAFKLWP